MAEGRFALGLTSLGLMLDPSVHHGEKMGVKAPAGVAVLRDQGTGDPAFDDKTNLRPTCRCCCPHNSPSPGYKKFFFWPREELLMRPKGSYEKNLKFSPCFIGAHIPTFPES